MWLSPRRAKRETYRDRRNFCRNSIDGAFRRDLRIVPEEFGIKVGEFSGSSTNEIDEFIASIHDSIAQLTSARDGNSRNIRKKRILNEIICALQLILQHATCQKCSDILIVSVDELNEFISICCDVLSAIDFDGNLDESVFRLFIVSCINLRARLSGAQGSLTKVGIKKGIIDDMDVFGFLVNFDSSEWDCQYLEEFLDDGALPIFKALRPKSKR